MWHVISFSPKIFPHRPCSQSALHHFGFLSSHSSFPCSWHCNKSTRMFFSSTHHFPFLLPILQVKRPPSFFLCTATLSNVGNDGVEDPETPSSSSSSRNRSMASVAKGSGTTARGRRLLKLREEKRKREYDRLHNYPAWAKSVSYLFSLFFFSLLSMHFNCFVLKLDVWSQIHFVLWAYRVLEDACKDDAELRAVLGDSIGDPELMRKRVFLQSPPCASTSVFFTRYHPFYSFLCDDNHQTSVCICKNLHAYNIL